MEKGAFVIMVITTLLSVLEEPTYGILVGTTIALLIFIKQVSAGDAFVSVFRQKTFFQKMSLDEYVKIQEKEDIVVVNFVGGLSYLNIEPLIESITELKEKQTILISFSHMGNLDVDGVE